MNTIEDLDEAMESKFKELGAEDVFKHLKLGNKEELQEAISSFEGNNERLEQIIRSYKAAERAHLEHQGAYNYRNYTNHNNKFRAELLGREILEDYDFVTLRDNSQMLVYKNGWWQPQGRKVVEEEANVRLGQEFMKSRVSNVVEYIKTGNYIKRQEFRPPKRKINLQNGVYDLDQGELVDHNPDYHFTFKINYPYDSGASCPKIDRFLTEVTESDQDKEKLYEIIAYALLPSNPLNKAAMLAGSGQNGKTVLLDVLKTFLGRDNIVNKSLQDLQSGFDAHTLYGKLAMIDDDLPPAKLQSTDMFKKLTGGTDIGAEIKFGDHYDFTPFAFPIFAANQIPPTPDKSHGFFRRWLIVDFPFRFRNNPNPNDPYQKQAMPRQELIDELTTQEEMEGLLAKCIEKLHTVLDNNSFSHEYTAEEIQKKWREHSTPIISFFERFVQQGRTRSDDERAKQHSENPDWSQWSFDYVRKDDLQLMISAYAKRRGAAKPSLKKITEAIKDSDLNAGPTRTRREPDHLIDNNSDKVGVYSGIKIVLDPDEVPEYLLNLYKDDSNQSIIIADGEPDLKEQVHEFMQANCSQDSMMYEDILAGLKEEGIISDEETEEDRALAIIEKGIDEGEYFEPVSGEVTTL
ncbi:phage/plasmid primase, P4 family [Halomontanus rarus]|uniref:phage/plasmid primase, P4 family n=1 Tax=Halomontanus rarus TaxID=3034020 RepID=UPI001A9A03CE